MEKLEKSKEDIFVFLVAIFYLIYLFFSSIFEKIEQRRERWERD